jgi:phosphoribosyl 1,2-cyclic phosphodiesterase
VYAYLCGVRGSTPSPGLDFARYGGHTSCIALARSADATPTLILDAGTGLRRATDLLKGQPFVGTILLTHLHWDHVQGLPFFGGGDRPDAEVSLFVPAQASPESSGHTSAALANGVQAGTVDDAEALLARMMSPPHFPIRPSQLRGSWRFSFLAPGTLEETELGVQGFSVETREVPHKGGTTYGYRVSDGISTLVYIPDHCPTVVGAGGEGWGEYHPAVMDLARDADVLIHDAHLVAEEIPAQAAFGHAAAEYAVNLGVQAGARHVVLFHHHPYRVDAALDEIAKRFAAAPLPVSVAVEGSAIDVAAPR